MKRPIFLLLVCALATLAAQTRAPAPRPRPAAPHAGAPTEPDEGSVSDDTYTNKFFGLQYTFPDNLDVEDQNSFMQGQLDQSQRAVVLLAAHGDSAGNVGREAVVLMADKLSPADGIADAAAYIEKFATPIAQKQGFTPVGAPKPVELAGQKFFRADYRLNDMAQAAIFTIRRGYAVGFMMIAMNSADLEHVVASLQTLKFATAAPPAPKKP